MTAVQSHIWKQQGLSIFLPSPETCFCMKGSMDLETSTLCLNARSLFAWLLFSAAFLMLLPFALVAGGGGGEREGNKLCTKCHALIKLGKLFLSRLVKWTLFIISPFLNVAWETGCCTWHREYKTNKNDPLKIVRSPVNLATYKNMVYAHLYCFTFSYFHFGKGSALKDMLQDSRKPCIC